MTVYLAGPITGVKDYAARFALAQAHLTGRGHRVLTPAVLPEGMAKGDYLRICLAMLDTADAVALLPLWRCSSGAKVEYAAAEYMGKQVLYLATDREFMERWDASGFD